MALFFCLFGFCVYMCVCVCMCCCCAVLAVAPFCAPFCSLMFDENLLLYVVVYKISFYWFLFHLNVTSLLLLFDNEEVVSSCTVASLCARFYSNFEENILPQFIIMVLPANDCTIISEWRRQGELPRG